MKGLLLILGLLLSFPSLSQTEKTYVQFKDLESARIEISRTSHAIFMIAKSCEEVNEEIQALKKWTTRIGEIPKTTKCVCSEKKCSAEITDIVPKVVREKQSTCTAFNGPNCWNSALVVSKLVSNLRFSTPSEMKFWLESPLCTERKPGEKRQAGDIIAIRNKYNEVHGFIHLSDHLSFSKNGAQAESPYSLQSPENVYEAYNVDKECRDIYKSPTNPECHIWANSFSCISVDKYFAKNPITNKKQKEVWASVEKFECDVSAISFSSSFNSPLRRLIKDSLKTIESLAKKQLGLAKTQQDKFVWNGILLKTQANLDALALNEFEQSSK